MVLVRSLSEAVGAVRTAPSLLLVSFAVVALQIPTLVTQQANVAAPSAVSLVSSIVSFFAGPIVLAGGVALAADALDGGGDLGSFVAGVQDHAVGVFVGYLGLLFVAAVFGVVGFVVFLIGGLFIGLGVVLGGGGTGVSVLGALAFLVLLFVVFVVPLLFVHFFGHAIVLDDQSVGDAFGRSVGVVRGNFLGMLGYGVVVFGFSFVAGLSGAVGSLGGAGTGGADTPSLAETVEWLPALSGTEVLALQAGGLVLTGLSTAVFWPFSVAVYREFRDRVVEPATDEAP